MGNPAGDFDNDGRTSLLESFQMAAEEIDALYRDQELLKGETPLLEDDNDGEPSQSPWRFATSGKDGKLAAACFLMPGEIDAAIAAPPKESLTISTPGGDNDE